MRLAAMAVVVVLCCVPGFSQEDPSLVVSLCDLQANPALYNHKRVEIQGTISHEFEDFSIHANCPPPENTVWLMYGGDAPDGVIYCCNGTGRKPGVHIEGIDVPLQRDELFRRLERLLNSYRIRKNQRVIYFQTNPSYRVHATLVGRYFAGKEGRGFGHMGCCSLLVIERVVSIDSVEPNLQAGEFDCYTEGWSERRSEEALAQLHSQMLKSGEKWRTSDGSRVAEEALKKYLETADKPGGVLNLSSCKTKHLTYSDRKDDQYEFLCHWSAGAEDSYSVDLLKFYFLKTAANAWKDIAWMPYEISHRHCAEYVGGAVAAKDTKSDVR